MIHIGHGIGAFIHAPHDHVLRLRGKTLIAERKGIYTWLCAKFLDPQSYRLPRIIQAIANSSGIEGSSVNRGRFRVSLEGRIRQYEDSRRRHPEVFSFRSFGWERKPSITDKLLDSLRAKLPDVVEKPIVSGPGGLLEDVPVFEYDPSIFDDPINVLGLRRIHEARFKICPVAGDGNCLFYSIATGFLSRMSIAEAIGRLDIAVAEAASVIEARGGEYGFDVDIRGQWAALRARLQRTDSETEIRRILDTEEIRVGWSAILRLLSLTKQLERWSVREVGLDLLMEEHRLVSRHDILTHADYLRHMMVNRGPNVVYAAFSEIIALQDCLRVRIPYMNTLTCGHADRVVMNLYDREVDQTVELPREHVGPKDVLLLLNDTVLPHFDPAFLPQEKL